MADNSGYSSNTGSIYYNPKQEMLKMKRELRKKILGSDSAQMRKYGEATKTRRAIKAELFGNKGKQTDTSIEIFAESILKDLSLKYVKQKAVRYLNFDFFLIEENMLIECEGEYWHCDPRVYPNGPKNDVQKKNLQKNIDKQEIAKSKNIPLIRLHEHDIKKNPEKTKKQIIDFISEYKNKNFIILETNYEIED